MCPDGELPKGGNKANTGRRAFDWHILRKVVCDYHFRGRSVEHCPECKDRIVCFEMIEDTLNLVDRVKK